MKIIFETYRNENKIWNSNFQPTWETDKLQIFKLKNRGILGAAVLFMGEKCPNEVGQFQNLPVHSLNTFLKDYGVVLFCKAFEQFLEYFKSTTVKTRFSKLFVNE